MKDYIAYYRVSTQKQSLGIDAQRTAVANYLMSIDGSNLVAEYSEKESGKNDTRNELAKAIAHCKKSGATLIIAKLDRLSRNVSFVFQLKDSGIDFIACDLPQFNTLTLAIFCGLAQQERELCSQRTKSALAELKARGVKLGRPNANFTDAERQRGREVVKSNVMNHPNTVKAVSMIKLLLQNTTSLTTIANKLNEGGFRTCKDAEFTPTTVRRIIHRHSLCS